MDSKQEDLSLPVNVDKIEVDPGKEWMKLVYDDKDSTLLKGNGP